MTIEQKWLISDVAAMAGVTVPNIQNWRARIPDGSSADQIFGREKKGWQRFSLQQVGAISVLGQAAHCGIALQTITSYAPAAGDSVIFWAQKIASKTKVNTPQSGPHNGSWSQSVKYLVAVHPVAAERNIFFSYTADPAKFPAWVKSLSARSFSMIDLVALGKNIAEKFPQKTADNLASSLTT